jgi:hypothetical protein
LPQAIIGVEGNQMFNIETHNGCITIQSAATGDHRTIRIKTQKDDAKFFPGKRLVELLEGPDNTTDYRSFGFILDNGSICLWKKHRSSKFYRWMARFLENPTEFCTKVDIHFEGRCRRCNIKLTAPRSIVTGIGPKCAGLE